MKTRISQYIPKKNGKLRPLSIPTLHDRAMQALHALALAPAAETLGDPSSYGFREGRGCADALSRDDSVGMGSARVSRAIGGVAPSTLAHHFGAPVGGRKR